MKKGKKWSRLQVLIPALLLIPPLGLYLLWRSPRTVLVKSVVSVLLIVFLAGAAFGVVKTGIYARITGSDIPPEGFCVDKDSRGHYVIPRILPREGEIFGAVVREMRRDQRMLRPQTDIEIPSLDAIQPEARAVEIVAEREGLTYEEVQSIYLKVSSLLAKGRK